MALRCFIAVDISDEVRHAVGAAIQRLKQTGADVKWVPAGNLHITLKFLGNTEEAEVAPVIHALQERLTPCEAVYIKVTGLGSFPAGRHPRVIWAGIEDGGGLGVIQAQVDAAMTTLGYPAEDRPYSPHLTVGRVKSGRGMTLLLKQMEELRGESFGEAEIRRVMVMKSELRPEGAAYAPLGEIELKRRNDDK